ncbi:hypothetical protein GGI25_002316 [Coemansia spiralis]|uniref:Uncharacterized protein n=1 Tax=Coemansia spiralis TaxID=417178 RepID=A0A9W8KZ73_9FUNG|nr:hypothetical protein BX070DRAFT_250199 [Coemansia spiralis]KAJ2678522.1 hypothetical protein GGI25_002316 [Coemansia spiralis]
MDGTSQVSVKVRCYQVYQQPGDAAFVPAGNAYQLHVLRNTICLQSIFASSECTLSARQMFNETTWLGSHPRRNNALPIMDIRLWMCMGNVTDRAKSTIEGINVLKSSQQTRKFAVAEGSVASSTPAKRRRRRTQPTKDAQSTDPTPPCSARGCDCAKK